MILIDANLLIYAVNRDAPLHRKAKTWLETTLSGTETVALTWNVLLAFLRLTTRPGLFRNPLPVRAAFDLLDAWIGSPAVFLIQPGPRHIQILRDLVVVAGTAGNLTSDAHLAAIAIENNAQLCTTDADFARFARLRWRNPLD